MYSRIGADLFYSREGETRWRQSTGGEGLPVVIRCSAVRCGLVSTIELEVDGRIPRESGLGREEGNELGW